MHAGLSLALIGTQRSAGAENPLHLDRAEDSLRALVKLRGDLSGERVLIAYHGTGLAVEPGNVARPLYRVQGLIRSQWTPQPDGTFLFRSFDVGFYGDLESGSPLTEFENPLNGKTVRPIHVRDGPASSVYSVHGSSPVGQTIDTSKALDLAWHGAGDRVWVERSFGFEFPNPLSPEEWPEASTGESIQFRFHNRFAGRLSELNDESLTSAPLSASYLGIGPFPPWLLMGQRPGHQVLSYQGHKIAGPRELSPALRRYIARTEPNYLRTEEPWQESLNSWQKYQRREHGNGSAPDS